MHYNFFMDLIWKSRLNCSPKLTCNLKWDYNTVAMTSKKANFAKIYLNSHNMPLRCRDLRTISQKSLQFQKWASWKRLPIFCKIFTPGSSLW